jgi:multimeric flavodoxin WrbA
MWQILALGDEIAWGAVSFKMTIRDFEMRLSSPSIKFTYGDNMTGPSIRKQSTFTPLTREQFRQRFDEKFYDPAFDKVREELEKVFIISWDGYIKYRKSPRNQIGGYEFKEPERELPIEWLKTREAIKFAEKTQKDPQSLSRILIINGSTRSEHTCPGEISKTLRLAQHAQKIFSDMPGFEVDFLSISDLADEPWKVIHPCKACVSTSMPLCHWPCSCYPNHALGQTNDWMNEIYPRWSAAHGIIILCPVHWYQVPASLKLMIDRLVCADGGNPDPTSTHGKDPMMAKELELKGWSYPKHLAGRAFSVVVHGDAAGPENVRRILSDWLTDIGMIEAGPMAVLDTFIGWYKPYATSHDELDKDQDTFIQVGNAAKSLANMVKQLRSGEYHSPNKGLANPVEK